MSSEKLMEDLNSLRMDEIEDSSNVIYESFHHKIKAPNQQTLIQIEKKI